MNVQRSTWCFCIGCKFLKRQLDAKTHYNWLIWSIQNIRANICKIFQSNIYGLTKKIFTYVKDEGTNLNTMTITLKSIVSCEALSAMKSFRGIWFEHAFSKACQYVATKERIFKGLKYVFYLFCSCGFSKMYYMA